MFIIVACRDGFWGTQSKLFEAAPLPEAWAQLDIGSFVVGLVCAAWALSAVGSHSDDDGRGHMRAASFQITGSQRLQGYVEYLVEAWATLSQPTDIRGIHAAELMEHLKRQDIATCSGGFCDPDLTVGGIMQRWGDLGAKAPFVVRVGAQVAGRVLCGALSILHCVAITGRLARKRLLNPLEPSKKQLAGFLSTHCGQEGAATSSTPAPPAPRRPNGGWLSELYDPELVLDWLDASSFVKDIRKTEAASAAFARVFSRSSGMHFTKVMSGMQMVHKEVLRRSRVRLDCVAMLLFRRFWATLLDIVEEHQVNLYLFADASPQWRGLEMYASSFDLVDGDNIVHKLFPLVALDKSFQDATGKCLALLWQVFLIVGPSYAMVSLFLRRVRSLTTDQGVERLLADFPLVLPAFFRLVDPAFQAQRVTADALLFPRALAVPGWLHLWDLLIRRGLESLDFFPSWLQGLKALVHFLRGTQHSTVIARNLRQRGLAGAADLIEQARLPTFAAWRWGTLRLCCDRLAPILASSRRPSTQPCSKIAGTAQASRPC